MNKKNACVAFTLFLTCVLAGQAFAQGSGTEFNANADDLAQIRGVVEQFRQDIIHKDGAALTKLMLNPNVLFHHINSQAEVDAARRNNAQFDGLGPSRLNGLVNFLATSKDKVEEKFRNIEIRQDGDLGLVTPATQITEIPDEFVVPEAQNDYLKRIEMIPMRDGVKLYTVIIVPKGAKDAPIVLTRTPNNTNRPTSLSSVAFAAGLSEQLRAQTPAPGTSFRDCSNGCPEMVVVQPGRFTMGAPAGEEARENLPDQLRGRSVPRI
jgi:hypothetical protein